MGGRAGLMISAPILLLASPLLAPQLLAFPYRTETAIGTVWSEAPLDKAMLDKAAREVTARMATTPLAGKAESRPIFVTQGGWRWTWLAATSRGAFALTRPVNRAVVVNATDPVSGEIRNGRDIGGTRELGSVLAHEFTHGLIRRRYGILAATILPTWKVEGYCDHVAGESTLSDTEAAALEAAGRDHPALTYYHGRKRVEAALAANGGSVDALFAHD